MRKGVDLIRGRARLSTDVGRTGSPRPMIYACWLAIPVKLESEHANRIKSRHDNRWLKRLLFFLQALKRSRYQSRCSHGRWMWSRGFYLNLRTRSNVYERDIKVKFGKPANMQRGLNWSRIHWKSHPYNASTVGKIRVPREFMKAVHSTFICAQSIS